MKSKTMKVCGPLVIIVAVSVPAVAQEPSTKFTGFLCELDLTSISNKPAGVPEHVFTLDTTKHCPGNTQSGVSESITIECIAKIPGWTGKSFEKNMPCRINGKQCGVPSFVNAGKER